MNDKQSPQKNTLGWKMYQQMFSHHKKGRKNNIKNDKITKPLLKNKKKHIFMSFVSWPID